MAIKIFGCYAETDRMRQSEPEQPRELDWYDYGSYESSDQATANTLTQDIHEEEDDIFSSYESEESLDNSGDQERHTDQDWDLFGSFGGDNKLKRGGKLSDEKLQSIDNNDVTEQRLEKSNWPMFDSIRGQIDAEYDESIVEKREGS